MRYALLLNAGLDALLVVSPRARAKSLGRVFGGSPAVGQAFALHALVRAGAGIHGGGESAGARGWRLAALGSLLIELAYALTAGTAFRHKAKLLPVVLPMIALVWHSLRRPPGQRLEDGRDGAASRDT